MKLIVEGYDETFTVFCTPRLSESFVRGFARRLLAKELGESIAYVHIKSVDRREEG